MGMEAQHAQRRLAACLKVCSGIVVGTTWLVVALTAASHFSRPRANMPPTRDSQEVLSGRSTLTVPTLAVPTPTANPVSSPTPRVSVAAPGATPFAPHAAADQNISAPLSPQVSRSSGGPREIATAPVITVRPQSASRFVPRIIEASAGTPGARYSLHYRSPYGAEGALLDPLGRQLVVSANTSGRVQLALIPAQSFPGLSKGPWTILICSESSPFCWTTVVIVSDGNAEIILRTQPNLRPP
jgi:hypothetical protein